MSKPKKRSMYMHTIDKRPAFYSDFDEQIVYADVAEYFRADTRCIALLRKNLRAIRRDQERTRRNRKSWGFSDNAGKYGYVRVEIPS